MMIFVATLQKIILLCIPEHTECGLYLFSMNERRMVFHLISLQNIVLFMCVSACVCVWEWLCVGKSKTIFIETLWAIFFSLYLCLNVFGMICLEKVYVQNVNEKKKRFQPTHRIKDTYFHLNPLILFYIFF